MRKKPLSPSEYFRIAQAPVMWFQSAQKLRSAAEIIISNQQEQERPYFRAVDDAGVHAAWLAQSAPEGTASVDILCEPPNYLPAQLLYAFAIENALKGLMLACDPELVGAEKLSKPVKTHDLVVLAKDAGFTLAVQEVPVLNALSRIAEWAGRYPVAAALKDYAKTGNSHPIALVADALLDWGSPSSIFHWAAALVGVDDVPSRHPGCVRSQPSRHARYTPFDIGVAQGPQEGGGWRSAPSWVVW